MVKEEMPLVGENDEQNGAEERNGQNSQVYFFTLLAADDTCRRRDAGTGSSSHQIIPVGC